MVEPPGPHPFRFGLQVKLPTDPAALVALARRAEDLGWSTLTVADHLDDSLAPLPALAAVASATSELQVGTMVLANDFRRPAVVAREAATLDVLSGGRFALGMGAGWKATDYARAGIALDLAAGGRSVRLVIGGGGERVLRLAARHADVVALNVNLSAGVIDERAFPDGTAESTERKLAWVRDEARGRGGEIELQARIHMAAVTDDRDGLVEAFAPAFGLTPAQALSTPHALIGTVEQLCDQLVERRERWGFSYVGLSLDQLDAFAPVIARLRWVGTARLSEGRCRDAGRGRRRRRPRRHGWARR